MSFDISEENDLRNPLAKAKGLGSAKGGSSIWWAQRVSALALVPLVIWFVYFMFSAVKCQNGDELMSIFTSPFPTIVLSIFITIGLYHGNIGIKEIIEDYVHCHSVKVYLNILVNFISFITIIATICALLVFHLSTFNFN